MDLVETVVEQWPPEVRPQRCLVRHHLSIAVPIFTNIYMKKSFFFFLLMITCYLQIVKLICAYEHCALMLLLEKRVYVQVRMYYAYMCVLIWNNSCF